LYSGLKGGALASAIHAHLKDGDPFNQSLVGQILRQVARPLRYLIDQWVYEGELRDIYDEFFVACNASCPEEKLWYDKYSLRKAMLPSFVPLELAQRVSNFSLFLCLSIFSVVHDYLYYIVHVLIA
jgi:gamma-tubulin complex component 3